MSEPRFTPGPWHYRPLEYDDWGTVRSSEAAHPRIIAKALAVPLLVEFDEEERIIDGCRHAKTDPYEANARLIAAAPELYAALERLWRAADSGVIEGTALRFAVAALAKARGDTK